MFLSISAFLAAGSVAVKTSDVVTDILLDNTLRKFVYDFRTDKHNKNGSIDESNEEVEIVAALENTIKI
jgi:hypothetical protein